MVDLAFLLLTFFVLTAELSKQNAITTTFPADGPRMPVEGMTVLIGKNPEKIFWYRGKFDATQHLTSETIKNKGLFNVLKNANAAVYAQVEVIDRQYQLGLLNDKAWSEKRRNLLDNASVPFVVIKWNDEASYQSVVSVIDQLNKSHNSKYAIVSMSEAEIELVKEQTK